MTGKPKTKTITTPNGKKLVVHPAKITDPEERQKVIDRVSGSIKTDVKFDFVRLVRGR